MKFPARCVASVFAALAFTSWAQAHPGHDDGHELTWELGHLAAHPLATFVCFAMFAAALWGGWKLVQAARTRREERVKPR